MSARLMLFVALIALLSFHEAGRVAYLRALVGENGEVYQANGTQVGPHLMFSALSAWKSRYLPIPNSKVVAIEWWQEWANITVVLVIAWLMINPHKHMVWWSRLAAFMIGFGLFQLFFYGWYYLLTGWPSSLLALNVLFLVPLPSVAPVFVSLSVSCLLVVTGWWWLARLNRRLLL